MAASRRVMWGDRAKDRAARVLAGLLSEHTSTEQLMRSFAKLQHARTVLDEAAGALWHLGALPSRHDVRVLQRRVSALRRRVAELDLALARLEKLTDRR
ncbi:hypothetical protein L6R52_41750 [Myxococcota bacterium]|nr:hypothetical protein [Myxococcota bacterium]